MENYFSVYFTIVYRLGIISEVHGIIINNEKAGVYTNRVLRSRVFFSNITVGISFQHKLLHKHRYDDAMHCFVRYLKLFLHNIFKTR